MKKIAMTMIALLTMTAAMAQQSDNKQRREFKKIDAQEMTERMATDLKLTDQQKAQLLELNKEYQDVLGGPGMGRGHRGGHHGPRPEGSPDKKVDGQTGATEQAQPDKANAGKRPELTEEQKAEMKKHQAKREEYTMKLKGILTDDQYKSYEKMRRHGGRGRGPRPQQN